MIITPGGSGQMIKSYILKEKFGYPIGKTFSIVFAERFFDLIAVTFIIIISLFFHDFFESYILILISCLIIGFVLILSHNLIYLKNFYSKIQTIKFIGKSLPDYEIVSNSFPKLFKPSVILKILTLVIPIAFLEGFLVYLGFLSFNIDIAYSRSIQLFYSSLLAGTFSFLPGGVGVMESSFTAFMTKENIDISLGSTVTIFIRLSTIWLATLIGFLFNYILMRKNNFN